MKKLRKSILLCLLACVLAASSAGCGKVSTASLQKLERADESTGSSAGEEAAKPLAEQNELPEDGVVSQAQLSTIAGKEGVYEFSAADAESGIRYTWSYDGAKIQNPVEQRLKVRFVTDGLEEIRELANHATVGLGITLEAMSLAAPPALKLVLPEKWDADAAVLCKLVDGKPAQMAEVEIGTETSGGKEMTTLTFPVLETGDTYYVVGGRTGTDSGDPDAQTSVSGKQRETAGQSNDTGQSGNADQSGSSDKSGGIGQSGNTDKTGSSDKTGNSDKNGSAGQSGSTDKTGNSDRNGSTGQSGSADNNGSTDKNGNAGQSADTDKTGSAGQSADTDKNGDAGQKEDASVPAKTHTCTISIDCITLANHMDKLRKKEKAAFVPEDGWLLYASEVEFTPGDTVYDVLYDACKQAGYQMEASYTPMYGSYYIEGINQLYEFDGGELSGWMYSVNGWYPNYGCSSYTVSDGDEIRFRYTLDLGKDIGGSNAVG